MIGFDLIRELSRKASRANNIWWRLSGLLGDNNRVAMYAILQAIFTVLTMALTLPLFKSYRLHIFFECLKVAASIWNGGIFFFDVMPRKMDAKKKRKFTPTNETRADAVSLNSTGLPVEGASVLDPPLSPGGLSPKIGEEVCQPSDGSVCSLCKNPSSIDLDTVDDYLQREGGVHVRKGRKLNMDPSMAKRVDGNESQPNGLTAEQEVEGPIEPAADLLKAATCVS